MTPLRQNRFLQLAAVVCVAILVAVIAWLTWPETEDPCAQLEADVGAAVLADQAGDQDALVNRAIIMRANCEKSGPEED